MMQLAWLLAWRVANAVLLRTAASPDEYWQALEPAHRAVFGYGHLTWEWHARIRSPVHALGLVAPVYALLAATGLDATPLLTIAPRLVMAVLAALCDWCTGRLATRLFGANVVFSATSMFNMFMLTRTLANSLETALTAIALDLWPWDERLAHDVGRRTLPALAIAAVSTVVRPTAVLIWIPLGIDLLTRLPDGAARLRWLFGTVVPVGAAACLAALTIDSAYYGWPTFTPWRFLCVNVLEGVSVFYGAHPWHWYFSQGLPFIAHTLLVLVRTGVKQASSRRLAYAALGTVALYSLLSHKEFRFVHPVLPVICVYAGVGAASLSRTLPTGRFRILVVGVVGTQVLLGLPLTVVHQRGVVDVVQHLRGLQTTEPLHVWFLMPCHSTPYHAHLHRPDATLRFITCEPPPPGTPLQGHQDESDVFYDNPVRSTDEWLAGAPSKPTHLVLFDALTRPAAVVLARHGYAECARFFNSYFSDDQRRAGDVVLLCSGVAGG